MSDEYRRIEIVAGSPRRRRWMSEQKLRTIEESMTPGESVSATVRRHGVAANPLYRWRRSMSGGGATAVSADGPVTGDGAVRRLKAQVRALERLLGRKTMAVETLKDALGKARAKKRIVRLSSPPADGSR